MDTGIFTTSFGLRSPENPILIDEDDKEEGYTESEPQSAQYPIISDDRDDMPQHDNTVLENDSRPSVRPCRSCFATRARVPYSRAVVVIFV
jgi:hypothetical protein